MIPIFSRNPPPANDASPPPPRPDYLFVESNLPTNERISTYDASGANAQYVGAFFLPSPADLVWALRVSPDGQTVAAGVANAVHLYGMDAGGGADVPARLADPAAGLPGQCLGLSWSPDGRYLVATHENSPYITIYDWQSGSPVKIANPSVLPLGSYCYGSCWSPDGRYLVVTSSANRNLLSASTALARYITIYDWQTGSPVKIADPAQPDFSAYACAWSLDGNWMAVAHSNGSGLTLYSVSGGVFTKVAQPASPPNSRCLAVAFSPDSRFLAVGGVSNDDVWIYDLSGGAPVKVAIPLATFGTVLALDWSADGTKLAVGCSNGALNYVATYTRSGATFTLDAAPSQTPSETVYALAFRYSPYGYVP